MISRILSGIVAIAYVAFFFFSGSSSKDLWGLMFFLVLCLVCIWQSEAMGDYVGGSGRGHISSRTPGWLVAAGGWLLLLMPVILELFTFFRAE